MIVKILEAKCVIVNLKEDKYVKAIAKICEGKCVIMDLSRTEM